MEREHSPGSGRRAHVLLERTLTQTSTLLVPEQPSPTRGEGASTGTCKAGTNSVRTAMARPFLLPLLWEKVARMQCASDEGVLSAGTPHPARNGAAMPPLRPP